MSRHHLALPCGATLAYGYDFPLQHYFIEVWNDNEEQPVYSKEGTKLVVFNWIEVYAKALGKDEQEIIELFPTPHLHALVMDQTF